jgi:colanic acid/amylovoran biosynthesis glycosyltransferase
MNIMDMDEPRVAIYVNRFLPYTQPWIYRQVSDPVTKTKLILAHQRIETSAYPFDPCVISEGESRTLIYLRGRFWPITKFFKSSLSKRNLTDFKNGLITNSINLVHAHFGTNGVLIAPLCKEINIPLVVTFHGFDISAVPLRWPAYKKELKKLFQQIKFSIVVSEEMAGTLHMLGCPKEKIIVSYLGVPLEKYPFTDRSDRQGPTRFLHAGRFTSKKGVPDLIRSFANAFPTPNTAILDIAGDGEEKALVLKTLEECKPINPVNLLGLLPYEELLKTMQKADVFVANSRIDAAGTKEGLPIAILEAAATGLPVISTYHAGIPETIIDKSTGRLINEYSNNELASALMELNDRKTQLFYGKNARQLMEEKYDLHKCNRNLSEIYKLSIQR